MKGARDLKAWLNNRSFWSHKLNRNNFRRTVTTFIFIARAFISGAFQCAYVYTPEVSVIFTVYCWISNEREREREGGGEREREREGERYGEGKTNKGSVSGRIQFFNKNILNLQNIWENLDIQWILRDDSLGHRIGRIKIWNRDSIVNSFIWNDEII